MSRETDDQMAIAERQLEHDRDMRAVERLHMLISQGSKGLSVLSGSAAVAILAFLQTLIEKASYGEFKPYAIGALGLFLIAAFLPTIVFFQHFSYLNKPFNQEKREVRLKIIWALLVFAVVCLFAGGLVTFIGIWFAL